MEAKTKERRGEVPPVPVEPEEMHQKVKGFGRGYIYDGGPRPRSPPPPPPEWVGSKTYVLATFSWNPPKHMVFTLF